MTNATLNQRLETVKLALHICVAGLVLTMLIWVIVNRRSFTNELYLTTGVVQQMGNDYSQVARESTNAMKDFDATVKETDATVKAMTATIQRSGDDVHRLVANTTPQINGLIADSRQLIVTANSQVESNGKETQAAIKRLGVTIGDMDTLLTGDQMKAVLANIGASAKNIRVVTENLSPDDVKSFMDSLKSSGANVELSTAQLAGVTTNMNAISKDIAVELHTALNPPKPQGFIGHLKYFVIQLNPVLKDGYLLLKLFGQVP